MLLRPLRVSTLTSTNDFIVNALSYYKVLNHFLMIKIIYGNLNKMNLNLNFTPVRPPVEAREGLFKLFCREFIA